VEQASHHESQQGQAVNAVQLSFYAGQKLKDLALDGLEGKYPGFLARARHVAQSIAERQGEVTADDVREILAIPVDVHPNVMGSVFREPRWRRIGWRRSSQPQRHANRVGVWRLRRLT